MKKLLMVLVVAMVLGAFASNAEAWPRRHYYYYGPRYVAPVVVAPAPTYYAPAPVVRSYSYYPGYYGGSYYGPGVSVHWGW